MRAMVLVLALTCVLNAYHVHVHPGLDGDASAVVAAAQVEVTDAASSLPDVDTAQFSLDCPACALLGHLFGVPPIGMSQPSSFLAERFAWMTAAIPSGRSYDHQRPPIGFAM